MLDNIFFIVNPQAGDGKCIRRFLPLCKKLSDKISFCVAYTKYSGHATLLTKKAVKKQYSAVVAVGGDGTIREIAAALLYTDIPLGILPFGTGNDFIRMFNIPPGDDTALENIIYGKSMYIDAFNVNNTLCINIAGLGFDVSTLRNAAKYKDKYKKNTAYKLGVLGALKNLKSHKISLEIDNNKTIEKDVVMLNIGNGMYLGGGMNACPNACISDGLLDVYLIDNISKIELLLNLYKFIKGKHPQLKQVHHIKAKKIYITATAHIPIQIDGEIIEKTPCSVEILKNALCIIAEIVK